MRRKFQDCLFMIPVLGIVFLTPYAAHADEDYTQEKPSGFFEQDSVKNGLLEDIDVGAPHRALSARGTNSADRQTSYYRRKTKRLSDSFNIDVGSDEQSNAAGGDSSGITPSFDIDSGTALLRPQTQTVTEENMPVNKDAVADGIVKEVQEHAEGTTNPGDQEKTVEYVKGLIEKVNSTNAQGSSGGTVRSKHVVTEANRF